ncbi:MAG TPA: GNAT family N-acetyltransferase [Solirubrobacteraceae bacterium]|nr:GNAT family N-acetyltransferase [Solirubrobacteraceae bacterium]
MASVHIAESSEELDPVLAAWDALAVEQRRPLLRPDWQLAWWRARCLEGHSDDGLRVAVVCDAHGLAGVAPMFMEGSRTRVPHLRFLGESVFYGGVPLVRSDVADETIRTLAAAIATMRPRPSILSFELIDVDSRWPDALVRAWPPSGAWVRRGVATTAVAVGLGGTLEEWVQTRPRKWRSDYRRRPRRFAEIGGIIRRARSGQEVSRGLSALIRLHNGRRSHESEWVNPVLERTFREAGERLVTVNGFRLWTIEVDDLVIGATAFAAAGGAVTTLFTGFDPAWGRFAPGLRSMIAGIEESFRLGEERVDLGYGGYPYKLKLANEVRSISSYEMFARGHRYPLVRAHELPRHARERFIEGRVRLRARSRFLDARNRIVAKRARSASR